MIDGRLGQILVKVRGDTSCSVEALEAILAEKENEMGRSRSGDPGIDKAVHMICLAACAAPRATTAPRAVQKSRENGDRFLQYLKLVFCRLHISWRCLP